MTRLILLNGPPGSGKSSMARRYADAHPLSLALDIDHLRGAIGRWADQPETAGLLARDVAVAAAQAHLANGHDVVVSQLVARPGFVERLEAIATRLDIDVQEVVLMCSREQSLTRRPDDEEVAALYDRLVTFVPTRPAVTVIDVTGLDLDGAYQALLTVVGEP